MIDYQKILYENMLNVFKNILENIKENGLSDGNHLYITFLTNHKNVSIPNWLKEKYPEQMTIVIQYEYYNLKINKEYFQISLSFNDTRADLKIDFGAIISFADPSANFGLILKKNTIIKKTKRNVKKNKEEKDNIINFSNFKKN